MMNIKYLINKSRFESKINFGVIVYIFFIFGCAQTAVKYTPEKILDNSVKINQFFEAEFEASLERSPESLTYFGSRKKYEKLDTQTYQDFKIEMDLNKISLQKMKAFDPSSLDENSKISYSLYEKNVSDLDQQDQFYYHNYFDGRHTHLVDFMMNQHIVNTEPQAWSYISRLNEFERAIQELIDKLKTQNEKGIKYPNFIFAKILVDAKNIISGFPFQNVKRDSDLYKDFRTKVARIDAPPNSKNILMQKAKQTLIEKVKPSYQKLISVVEDLSKIQTENNGVWALPQGKEYYQYLLKQTTTTNLTPQEIHKMGLSEVERIQNKMKTLILTLGFAGTLKEFFESIKSESLNDTNEKMKTAKDLVAKNQPAKLSAKLFYANTWKGRQDYLNDNQKIISNIQAKLPELFNVFPKAKLVVRPVEKYREFSAPLAFYESPAPDGSRPAIYYINMADMGSISKFDMEALAYHEAIPGHHMQIAISQELTNIPKFRKHSHFTAYSEGWGLYAEQLPKEIGFYQDPYSEFGRLSMELWRAARLVVDPGIHFYRWSKEKSIEYMNQNTSGSNDKNIKEIERYFMNPGQAVSYKVGQMKILELRAKTQKALKSKFDLKEFHDVILKNGPLPFNLLEKVVEQYIQSKLIN